MNSKSYREYLVPAILWIGVAFVITTLNYPLARFARQDLLWNDLVLLGRVAWAKSALFSPMSSIDFLQGLGNNVRFDVKVIPHFFDPAVLFSLVTDSYGALWYRTFFLALYCLVSLYVISEEQIRDVPGAAQLRKFQFPIIATYVLAPQFFFEVGHHFSAIFYTIPGVIWALHAFLRSGSLWTGIGFVVASTLMVHTSDLHIVFIASSLGGFLLLFDRTLWDRTKLYRLFLSVAVLSVIVALSFPSLLAIFSKTDEMTVNSGRAPELPEYYQSFLKPAFSSLLVPTFSGPISLYLSPVIPFFICIVLYSKRYPKLLFRLVLLILMVLALFLLGIVLHGVPTLRAKLPSLMRYHLAIVPFLATLWLLFHLKEVGEILERVRASKWIMVSAFFCILAGSYSLTPLWHSPDPKGYVAINKYEIAFDPTVAGSIGLWSFVLFPLIPFLLAMVGFRFSVTSLKGAFVYLVLFLVMSTFYIFGRSLGLPSNQFGFVDTRLFQELYKTFPASLDQMIKASPRYSHLPRSFVPVAASSHPVYPTRGWNDKLLPLLEYPESVGGRAFFQWRYSYTTHTSQLYQDSAHSGPVCIFPPEAQYARDAIDFAIKVGAPFVISADAVLDDPRLEHLGTHVVDNDHLSPRPDFHTGLLGTVYLYGIRNFVEDPSLVPFDQIHFGRTSIKFVGVKTKDSMIKLPVTYLRGMIVVDQEGRERELSKGADGFGYVSNDGSIKEIILSSRSYFSLSNLLAPFAGLALIALGLLRRVVT